jgi:hypothetical protein
MAGNVELEQGVQSAPLLSDADRFRLLGRLLEDQDLQVLERFPAVASQARKSRARIFSGEISLIRREVHTAFRSRLHRIGECGQWTRIFGLVADTASAYAALSKLKINGELFRYSVPRVFQTAPNTEQLCRYVTFEMLTVADQA